MIALYLGKQPGSDRTPGFTAAEGSGHPALSRFTHTQVERDANRSRAQTQPYADGIAERAKAAMLRSAEMEQIMATIAEQFVCYQVR